jgi:hypothetical protein
MIGPVLLGFNAVARLDFPYLATFCRSCISWSKWSWAHTSDQQYGTAARPFRICYSRMKKYNRKSLSVECYPRSLQLLEPIYLMSLPVRSYFREGFRWYNKIQGACGGHFNWLWRILSWFVDFFLSNWDLSLTIMTLIPIIKPKG